MNGSFLRSQDNYDCTFSSTTKHKKEQNSCVHTLQTIQKKRQQQSLLKLLLPFEPKAGLEPATYSLRMNCSTN